MKGKFLKEELEKEYDLELDKAVEEIKKRNAKTVCIQFPEGLKDKATKVAEFLESNTEAKCLIWLGTCFGGCDYPNLGNDVDLLIQFGHAFFVV